VVYVYLALTGPPRCGLSQDDKEEKREGGKKNLRGRPEWRLSALIVSGSSHLYVIK